MILAGEILARNLSHYFYIVKFGASRILQPVKEINTCLKMLQFSCDDISENIKRIKANSDIQNIEDLFNQNKVKMFHNVVAKDNFVKLVSDCQTYRKKCVNFKKYF